LGSTSSRRSSAGGRGARNLLAEDFSRGGAPASGARLERSDDLTVFLRGSPLRPGIPRWCSRGRLRRRRRPQGRSSRVRAMRARASASPGEGRCRAGGLGACRRGTGRLAAGTRSP